jgi:molybdate transport system substrate-binding protein
VLRSQSHLRRVAVTVALLVTGASAGVAAPAGARVAPKAKPTGSITVFAASSLTEAFAQIGKDFQKKFNGTTVTFTFGSSATLETQLEQGAPGDVFASADTVNPDKLKTAGDVSGSPVVFARNRLEIAVEHGNPKKIKTLADTVKSGVLLTLCAPEVPCGKYALQAYQEAGVTVPQVPTGLTAKDTLSRVTLGEADAAVVYVTDVKAAGGDVTGVKIRKQDNVIAQYPLVVVKGTQNAVTAKAFVKYVTSKAGLATLKKFGFLSP